MTAGVGVAVGGTGVAVGGRGVAVALGLAPGGVGAFATGMGVGLAAPGAGEAVGVRVVVGLGAASGLQSALVTERTGARLRPFGAAPGRDGSGSKKPTPTTVAPP